MSTSLLYHAFGIRGYQYVYTKYEDGQIIFKIEHDPKYLRCPCCNSKKIILRGKKHRFFQTVPIGFKPVFISLDVQRVLCLKCGVVRQVNLGFADERRTYTKSFERLVMELSKVMTIKDVSKLLRVSWDIVKDIQKRNLKKRFSKPRLKHLKQIAIDEISVGKGHKYLSIVMDLKSGAIVFVGDGKGKDALEPFWKRLRASRAKVEAVAIDMSPAYISAVIKNLKDATIVFDHFHVIKLFNDKLSDFRRDLHRHTENMLEKEFVKGTRWLLLKNFENLDKSKGEVERLNEAIMINKPLATAYYMKESLRMLWDRPDKECAEHFLDCWIAMAKISGVTFLQKFANTLMAHKRSILAYYDYPISTGPLEGMNNKIKTMKRQAYGFRDDEFFKLKIMAIHQTKYALVG